MSNPLRSLKFLPWRWLFQAAFLTMLVVAFLEFFLSIASQSSPVFGASLEQMFGSPLGVVLDVVIAIAIGVLAVVILERVGCPSLSINSLWGLVACLLLSFAVKQVLPLTPMLFNIDLTHIVGMVVGVFWKDRFRWW